MTTLFISHSSKDKEWAEQIHKALRGQGYQSLFLDSHPDDGIHAGAEWEQTLWQRLRQSRGVVVLCTANWLASPWCVAEAMMARERGKSVFMLVTAEVAHGQRIPDFLKDRQSISLADITEVEGRERLWRGLAEEGLKDDFPLPTVRIRDWSPSKCPMPPCFSDGTTRSPACGRYSNSASATTPGASS